MPWHPNDKHSAAWGMPGRKDSSDIVPTFHDETSASLSDNFHYLQFLPPYCEPGATQPIQPYQDGAHSINQGASEYNQAEQTGGPSHTIQYAPANADITFRCVAPSSSENINISAKKSIGRKDDVRHTYVHSNNEW